MYEESLNIINIPAMAEIKNGPTCIQLNCKSEACQKETPNVTSNNPTGIVSHERCISRFIAL